MASVGFIGVGKLGQACAEMVAEVHDVVGYDVNPVSPENFKMSDTLEGAVKGQDIVFIAVPTPHDPKYDGKAPTSHLPNKDFDYSLVKQVLSFMRGLRYHSGWRTNWFLIFTDVVVAPSFI